MSYTHAPAFPSWPCLPRRGRRTLLLTGTALAFAPLAAAFASSQEPASRSGGTERLWSPVAEDTLATAVPPRHVAPGEYRTVRLDRGALLSLLAQAPLAGTKEAKSVDVVMELPWPDGSFRRFRIEELSIRDLGMPARCPPDLKTYRGRGTESRSLGVRFEWSASGFHAKVYSDESGVYISPHSPGDTQNYTVFYGRDWTPGTERTEGAPAAATQAVAEPSPAVPASPTRATPAFIEEIAIERNCYGCEYPYTLTFGRDGTGMLMMVGVLRHGTVDHACRGPVAPEAFAALANLVQEGRFFDLKDSYFDPRLEDGASVKTTVVVNGRRKTVRHRDDVGPPGLKAIENAVHALAERVSWTERRP